MLISFKTKSISSLRYLYAVADRDAISQAIRNVFCNHSMPIHAETNNTLTHYPGGYFDRANSAYQRFITAYGTGPGTDSFSIRYEATNNLSVTLVCLYTYHKAGGWLDAIAKKRTNAFYASFYEEIERFDILIIPEDSWDIIVEQAPQLRCSPDWKKSKHGQ